MSKQRSPWLIAFIVSIATFMEVLDTTITNVSLRHIAGSLGAGCSRRSRPSSWTPFPPRNAGPFSQLPASP